MISKLKFFGYLRPNNQEELASHMEVGVLAQLFRDMSSDERADVYALLDVKLQDAVMRRLAKREREDLLRLASYEGEGTRGGGLVRLLYLGLCRDPACWYPVR